MKIKSILVNTAQAAIPLVQAATPLAVITGASLVRSNSSWLGYVASYVPPNCVQFATTTCILFNLFHYITHPKKDQKGDYPKDPWFHPNTERPGDAVKCAIEHTFFLTASSIIAVNLTPYIDFLGEGSPDFASAYKCTAIIGVAALIFGVIFNCEDLEKEKNENHETSVPKKREPKKIAQGPEESKRPSAGATTTTPSTPATRGIHDPDADDEDEDELDLKVQTSPKSTKPLSFLVERDGGFTGFEFNDEKHEKKEKEDDKLVRAKNRSLTHPSTSSHSPRSHSPQKSPTESKRSFSPPPTSLVITVPTPNTQLLPLVRTPPTKASNPSSLDISELPSGDGIPRDIHSPQKQANTGATNVPTPSKKGGKKSRRK